MTKITDLIELRYYIISVLKSEKRKLTFKELTDILYLKKKLSSIVFLSDIVWALHELNYYTIIDIEYNKGFNIGSILENGDGIKSISV